MAAPVQWHTCPTCSYKTTLNSRIESHKFDHDFPKTQRLFNCANSIEPLRCFQCTSFETHELVDLKQHLKVDHTGPESEEKPYVCGRPQQKWNTASEQNNQQNELLAVKQEGTSVEREESKRKNSELCRAYRLGRELLATEHEDSDSTADKSNNLIRENFQFMCDECGFSTNHEGSLDAHFLREHTNPDDIEWLHCALFLRKDRDNLVKKKHNKTLEEIRCDQCRFATRYRDCLERHIMKKHTSRRDKQWFRCVHCAYKGRMQNDLYNHMKKMHNPALNIRCDQCRFRTRFKEALERHILLRHTNPEDIQLFPCALCSYEGQMNCDLYRHMKNKHDITLNSDVDLQPDLKRS